MAKEKRQKTKAYYSGIGGQAVLEGIMMKNVDKYAVAIRKPNDEIEVDIDEYSGILKGHVLKNIPFLRGVFNFIDSLVLGMKTINYSATFYEDDVNTETKFEKALNKVSRGKADKVISAVVTVFSILLAIGIFIVLPYYLTGFLTKSVRNDTLTNLIEGLIRLVIFILYVLIISLSKDIKRVYMYHGAEHKCINCIEHGHPLTVNNVMKSSRLHRRCGTSFLLLVILVSIILFFFIHVDSRALRLVIRILLIPVIAGISYEILRLAGRTSGLLVRIISAPGLLLQKITTREPDEKMVEVAIQAVEAVFDWKDFLKEKFNWDENENAEASKEQP